ncbi:MAG: NAD-binding protein, partial [Candidatus Latescibacteria bacterium]|nr:NAD-binding protein [Candidatus Latescibacterota bacterium]
MRIIIAGGGDIAFQFARELADKRDTVVVMEDPGAAARFDRLDVQVVLANPASAETLRSLDVNKEDDFIACSEADELNIIACLTAKQIFGAHTICFVSKEEYYKSFTLQLGPEPGMMIDRIIWPQYMLAEEIANIVLVPKAIDVEILEGGRIWLQEYRIRAKSPLLEKPVDQLDLHDGVLAVAVARDDDFYIPRGDTVFHEGDKVSFMGTKKALRAVEKK